MHDILNSVATKGSVAVLAALLISACEPVAGPAEPDVTAGKTIEKTAAGATTGKDKPAGAVLIENDLYAVPMAVDKNGCEQFRTWSEAGIATLTQPIYYRDGEGSFSRTLSEDSSCNARMVETGIDEEGCPTFDAVQPDSSSSGVSYYRSQKGSYTTNKERSACEP